ncbi:serine racemase VanT catalytic subunit [Gehongia tenuis]|uniref:Alanine racemase n=1 Tax=Gehongia tenuis TaxID=2763655 RepID=A0A926D4E1_9FIRM|nr:serine racemase VanT catalytic subunit [Gehongia tenuis]MBC8531132.1 serine racemase VanT catalytic subunit [Gehongia tenuis]
MRAREGSGGLDAFRVAAALLVVAIHTSPLESVNGTADFVLTRILARVAVPFFLMVTGFFLLPAIRRGKKGVLRHFLVKTAMLYGAAILIYLPVLIYNGYFVNEGQPWLFLRDLLLEGTFYHLWYLPASMLGMLIVVGLMKWFQDRTVLFVAAVLYGVGLLGDSYYGLTQQIPLLSDFYGALFSIIDYTRNGLFYAPIFLCLGLMARDMRIPRSGLGLGAGLALMIMEGLMLHHFAWQRHDSMYLWLPLVMVYLFACLLKVRSPAKPFLRRFSMAVYILHPMAIVLVRGAGKALHLKGLMDISPLYYLAVAGLSVLAAGLYAKIAEKGNDARERAWVEINLRNLYHNVEELKKLLPEGCALMAVVKANAYGHGAVEIARALHKAGITAYATATAEEGVQLRKRGIRGDILVLGYTPASERKKLRKYRLIQTVADSDHARALSGKKPIRAHVAVDTGMHRLGEDYARIDELCTIYLEAGLKVEGLSTHLCAADSTKEEDILFTYRQIERFWQVVKALKARGVEPGKLHFQSTYGLLNYDGTGCAYARVGIALYGVLSSPNGLVRSELDLRPVLSLKGKIGAIREIEEGETLGYGRAYRAKEKMTAAVVTLGYADGIPRGLTGEALVHGRRVPIVGRICMDQLTLDVSGIEDVKAGDVVTLIGRDGEAFISAEEAAAGAGTITNELLSRLGPRLGRVVLS